MDRQQNIPGYPKGMKAGEIQGISKHQDIHTRLMLLAAYARRTGQLLVIFTFISAILVFIAFLTLGVFLSREIAWGGILNEPIPSDMGFLTWFIWFEILVVIGGLGFLFGCSIAALIYVRGLFAKHRESTLVELYAGELGLVVADPDLWVKMQLRLQKGAFGISSTMYYLGLERHLILCVSHWDSLKQVSAGKKRLSRFRRSRCHQDFSQVNTYYKPKWWTIVGTVILGLLLSVYLFVFIPISLVLNGSRYIIIYARLAALAEFYLGERDFWEAKAR